MLIDVGQVVAKKYELVRLLGRGSMGEVWSAHHQALREQVAIKVLAWPPSGEDAEAPAVALERFRVRSRYCGASFAKDAPHRAGDRLRRRRRAPLPRDGAPRRRDARRRAADARLPARACRGGADHRGRSQRALGQAHAEAVAHRDLKPANVFLTRATKRGTSSSSCSTSGLPAPSMRTACRARSLRPRDSSSGRRAT